MPLQKDFVEEQNMEKYLAMLRGLNTDGKNKIKATE